MAPKRSFAFFVSDKARIFHTSGHINSFFPSGRGWGITGVVPSHKKKKRNRRARNESVRFSPLSSLPLTAGKSLKFRQATLIGLPAYGNLFGKKHKTNKKGNCQLKKRSTYHHKTRDKFFPRYLSPLAGASTKYSRSAKKK